MQLDRLILSRQALELLESDAIKAAFASIDKALYAEWQKTTPVDTESRENAYHKANGVRLVISELEKMAVDARTEREAKKQEQGESRPLRRSPLTA